MGLLGNQSYQAEHSSNEKISVRITYRQKTLDI
jgi:hypothetical protein